MHQEVSIIKFQALHNNFFFFKFHSLNTSYRGTGLYVEDFQLKNYSEEQIQ